MNPFDELCSSEVFIVKRDGVRSGPHKCSISSSKVTIFDEALDVDEGSTVLRDLPNGKTESYTVLEANYKAAFHSIPAHYALNIQKDSSLVSREKTRTTNINITNSQGFQIGDHNVQSIVDSFKALVDQIDEVNASEEDKRVAKSRLQSFLEHPLVCAILGGAASGILGMLGKP